MIRYYRLQSGSTKPISKLEGALEKYLLDERYVKGVLTGNGSQTPQGSSDLSDLLFDSGDFEVLYRNSRPIGNRRFWLFGARRTETEIVIAAMPEGTLAFQDYLKRFGFDVVEARKVSTTTLSFATKDHDKLLSNNYLETIKKMVDYEEYAGLKLDTHSYAYTVYSGYSSHLYEYGWFSGIVSGDVVKALRFRRLIGNIAQSFDTRIIRESATFA